MDTCNTLQHTAAHCNTLQHTATHCNILQHTAAHCITLHHTAAPILKWVFSILERGLCNSVIQSAVQKKNGSILSSLKRGLCIFYVTETSIFSSLERALYILKRALYNLELLLGEVYDCNTLQHTATHCSTLQHTAAHCNTLQHTAVHCSILEHTYSEMSPVYSEKMALYTLERALCILERLPGEVYDCNTLQHTAAHYNTLQQQQHTATQCSILQHLFWNEPCRFWKDACVYSGKSPVHSNMAVGWGVRLQYTATCWSTL